MAAECVTCLVRPPRKTTNERRACEACTAELANLLDELDDAMPLLPDMLVPSGVPSSVRLARDASPAPLRVDVLVLLDDRGDLSVYAVLGQWAAQLAEERRLSGKVDPIVSLRAHLGYVAATSWVEDFARDLRRLALAVRRVIGEQAHKVATCHRDMGGRECGGPILASSYSDSATCSRCGDSWPRERWRLLGRLDAAEPVGGGG